MTKRNLLLLVIGLLITAVSLWWLAPQSQTTALAAADQVAGAVPTWLLIDSGPDFARRGMGAAYDSGRQVVVMFGGLDQDENLTDEIWEYGPIYRTFLPEVTRNYFEYTCDDRPVLLYPRDHSTIDTLIPQYKWDSCDFPAAISTYLVVSPNPNLSDFVFNVYTGATGLQSYQDMTNLIPGTRYYWQLSAHYDPQDPDSLGPTSEGTFVAGSGGTLLPAPLLVSPADNSTLPGNATTLEWQAVAQADRYLVEWGHLSGDMYVKAWVDGTQQAVTLYDPSESYYWQVSAVDAYAIGNPSARRTITAGP
ncbi:MAG: hypothetical protein JW726_04155 [Anaerolineales bacterium]|nr:hypothetical protein [Anaerolineales bacterium]